MRRSRGPSTPGWRSSSGNGLLNVGGVEIIGYDAERAIYTSHFFDSQGHVSIDELLYDDGRWNWRGERLRTTSTFSADGTVQHSLHEQSDDGVAWRRPWT
jgi:hypothetical protein